MRQKWDLTTSVLAKTTSSNSARWWKVLRIWAHDKSSLFQPKTLAKACFSLGAGSFLPGLWGTTVTTSMDGPAPPNDFQWPHEVDDSWWFLQVGGRHDGWFIYIWFDLSGNSPYNDLSPKIFKTPPAWLACKDATAMYSGPFQNVLEPAEDAQLST